MCPSNSTLLFSFPHKHRYYSLTNNRAAEIHYLEQHYSQQPEGGNNPMPSTNEQHLAYSSDGILFHNEKEQSSNKGYTK